MTVKKKYTTKMDGMMKKNNDLKSCETFSLGLKICLTFLYLHLTIKTLMNI